MRKLTLPNKPLVKPGVQTSALKKPAPTLKANPKPAAAKQSFDDTSSLGGAVNDGFAVARQINAERQRQAEIRKNQPRDFWMKVGEGGVNGVGIILTDTCSLKKPAPNNLPFFHYMHHWGFQKGVANSGKSEVCLQDSPEGCELCGHLGRKGSHEMVLSCIDTRTHTVQSGPNAGKVLKNERKLLIVKTQMIPKFERLYREHGTFRGMCLKMFRDGDKDPSIGSEVRFVKMLTEQELAKYGENGKPVEYLKAFPRPTNDELRQRYGIGGGAGIGGGEFGGGEFGDDDIPF